MGKFIRQIIGFSIPLVIFLGSGLFLPPTPRASKSLLFANIEKDSLLQNTAPPRIIFIGGSNLSFGLNSQMIKDSLNLNPINTGVHASIGLRYMLANTLQYVNKGDIVVLVPEYGYFYQDYNSGSAELLRTIFDVNPSKIKLLNIIQLLNIMPFIPEYTLSKLKPREYINVTESDIYSVNSFNQYGDTYTHWGLEREEFIPYTIGGDFNQAVIQGIKEFQTEIEKKNAILLVSYPGFQDVSYLNSIEPIKKIETECVNNGFRILGSPERYVIPNSMIFNTPYHLTKNGVDYRTGLFIEDFREYNAQHGICDICGDE